MKMKLTERRGDVDPSAALSRFRVFLSSFFSVFSSRCSWVFGRSSAEVPPPLRLDYPLGLLILDVFVHALGHLTQPPRVETQALLVPVLLLDIPGHHRDPSLGLFVVVVVVPPAVLVVVPGGRREPLLDPVYAGVIPEDRRPQAHRVELLGHGWISRGLDSRPEGDKRSKVLAAGKGGAGEPAYGDGGVGAGQLQGLGSLLGLVGLLLIVRGGDVQTLGAADGVIHLLPQFGNLEPGVLRALLPKLCGEGGRRERPAKRVHVPGRLVHLVVRVALDGPELGVHGGGDSLLVGDTRADEIRLLDDALLLPGRLLSLPGRLLRDGRPRLHLGGSGEGLSLPLHRSFACGFGLGGESINLASLRVGGLGQGDTLRLRALLLGRHLRHLVEELRLLPEEALRVISAGHCGRHLHLPRHGALLRLRQLAKALLQLCLSRHRLALPVGRVLLRDSKVLGQDRDGVGHLSRLPRELFDVLVDALLQHGDLGHLLELGVGVFEVLLGGAVPRLRRGELFGGELGSRDRAVLNLLSHAFGGGDARLGSLQGLGHLLGHLLLRRLRLRLLLDGQLGRLIRHLSQGLGLLLERLDRLVALRHRLLHVAVLADQLVDAVQELVLVLELPLGVGCEFLSRVPRLVRSLDFLLSLDERRLRGGLLISVQRVPGLHLDRLGGGERVGSLLDHAVHLRLGRECRL
mmetsp:Transcript_2262/g.9652  ORF Transcript_2262/g.9652 Transcript_2262/m.9652 type:complete len:689 (+) Transcript_2262:93-2159(+)